MLLSANHLVLILLTVFLGTAIAAEAQPKNLQLAVDMFLKIEGVDGESKDEGHVDWIEIVSYGHGLTNEVLGTGGGGTSAPVHSPVVVRKLMDKSSPFLFDALNKGSSFRNATFDFEDRGQAVPYLFLKVTLEDLYVTSYSLASEEAGADRPVEEVAFTYTRITMTYWPQNTDGTQGPPITVGWDVAQNIPTSVAMQGIESWVEGRDVLFRWQTSSQAGNYGFEVQKLEEAGFRRAAYVPGAGWSSEPLEYEVRIRGLRDGVHVFRVAGLGVGGRTTYSEEISVAIGLPEGFSLLLDGPYPNPFSERAGIAVTVEQPIEARIAVWDVLGREVGVIHDGRIPAGFEAHYEFEPSRPLPAGVYVLRVQSDRGAVSRLMTHVP